MNIVFTYLKYSSMEGVFCQALFWVFLKIPALTFGAENGIVSTYGELSERFKEPVLKTGDSERNLGFESLTLRQYNEDPLLWGGSF